MRKSREIKEKRKSENLSIADEALMVQLDNVANLLDDVYVAFEEGKSMYQKVGELGKAVSDLKRDVRGG